jgi:hypothetical protein
MDDWYEVLCLSARKVAGDVMVALNKAPTARKVSLRLRVDGDVAAMMGLAADDRVKLVWGRNKRAGSVRVSKTSEAGWPKARRTGPTGTVSAKFERVPRPGDTRPGWWPVDEKRTAIAAESRIEDGGLVIDLPRDWWQAATPAAPSTSLAQERAEVEHAAAALAHKRAEIEKARAAPVAPRPPVAAKAASPQSAEEKQAALCDELLDQQVQLTAKGRSLLDSEIIRHVRCTPQFLEDRKALQIKRRAAERAEAARPNGEVRP